MGDCYTKSVKANFGPGPDQVGPNIDLDQLNEKYAQLGDFWFYDAGSADDRAFGLNSIELRITKSQQNNVLVRMTYNNNGYEGGSGATPYSNPLTLVFYRGGFAEAAIENVPYNVPCHSGEFHQWEGSFQTSHFYEIDSVEIPAGLGFSVTC